MSKSRIFLYLCLSLILGVFISSFFNIPQLVWLISLVIGLILITVWWGRWKVVLVGFCLCLLIGGIARHQISVASQKLSEIRKYNDQEIVFKGIISKEPDIRKGSTKYAVKSAQIKIANQWSEISGQVLVTSSSYPEYQYGDEIEIKGELKTPAVFEDFSYKDYLARYNIYSVIYYPEIKLIGQGQGHLVLRGIFTLKDKFENIVNSILPEPQASFLAGLLLGVRRGIPDDLMEAFNLTGTTHIIAISGYNVTIVAALLMSFLIVLTIPRPYTFWLAVIGILLFTILTGASPSVVRAAIMGILVLVALKAGRLSNVTNAIILTGCLMLLINPKILRADVGFQLSFLATLGIVYFSPILEKRLQGIPNTLEMRNSLLMTISAQLAAVPIIVYNFERLSLIAPLANVLILPVIPLTMLAGFIPGLVGFVWLGLAKILAWPAWLFLTYEIKIAEWLAKVPFASIEVENLHWVWLLGYYLCLVIIFVFWRKKQKHGQIKS